MTTPFDRIQVAVGPQGTHSRRPCGCGCHKISWCMQTEEQRGNDKCGLCSGRCRMLDIEDKWFKALWVECAHKNAAWRDTAGMMAFCPDCHVEWDSFPLYPKESLKAPIAYIPRPRAECIEPLWEVAKPMMIEHEWILIPAMDGWEIWRDNDEVDAVNDLVAKGATPTDALAEATEKEAKYA